VVDQLPDAARAAAEATEVERSGGGA